MEIQSRKGKISVSLYEIVIKMKSTFNVISFMETTADKERIGINVRSNFISYPELDRVARQSPGSLRLGELIRGIGVDWPDPIKTVGRRAIELLRL
jgi:hypothetical protein